jgi:hypothetical protein
MPIEIFHFQTDDRARAVQPAYFPPRRGLLPIHNHNEGSLAGVPPTNPAVRMITQNKPSASSRCCEPRTSTARITHHGSVLHRMVSYRQLLRGNVSLSNAQAAPLSSLMQHS